MSVLLRFILIFLISLTSFAQEKFNLSGIIYDENSGETLLGINVLVSGTKKGTASNIDGFYSLSLEAGSYIIEISGLGYKTEKIAINLSKNIQKDIFLTETGENLNEVIVRSRSRETDIRSSQMSVNTLSTETIKRIPVVLGEVDVIKSLTLLPGVSSGGEGSGGFHVRGGAADQNLILLDDAVLYDSSHLFGFFSVFNPDAIKNLTLYKGAVPARYGGRLASVLEIQQKTGNNNRYKANGGVGLISSRLMLEGPIQQEKSSFLLAGRSSYAHLFLPLFDIDNKAFFYDINTHLSHRIDDKNNISLSGYFGRDVFRISESFSNAFGSGFLNFKWNHIYSDDLISNLSVIMTDYHYGLELDLVGFEYDGGIRNYNLKYDFTQYAGNSTWRYGIYSGYYHFNPGNIRPLGIESGIHGQKLTQKYAWENAVYGEIETSLGDHISLQAGLRLSSFNRLGQSAMYLYEDDEPVKFNSKFKIYEKSTPIDTISLGRNKRIKHFLNPEPRIGVSFILDDNQSIKAGYNRMVQYLHLISNTSSPTPLDVYAPSGKYIQPQKSDQFAVGYFRNINSFSIEFETFYKKIQNRLDYIPGADLVANNAIEQVLLNGRSKAYGLEFLTRKNEGKLQGWISYTWSKSLQQTPGRTPEESGINNGEWYASAWDRLHDLSITAQYLFSDKWDFGANFIFQTGRPVTYPEGQYIFDGAMIPVYEARNKSRLPAYHRMDVSATFTPKKNVNKKWKGQWVFSIYNLYNKKNAASISFRENKETYENEAVRLSIFGIIPSVTYNFEF